MDIVTKDSQPTMDALQTLHQLIQLLTDGKLFRKNLPDAIGLLNRQLKADCSLLLELAEVSSDLSKLAFKQLLQVSKGGDPIGHALPFAKKHTHISTAQFKEWLRRLNNQVLPEQALDETLLEKITEGVVIYGAVNNLGRLSEAIDISTIITSLNIGVSSYIMLPLLQGKRILGCLFFFIQKEVLHDSTTLELVLSGARLLTNALARQQNNNTSTTTPLEKRRNQEQYPDFLTYSSEGIYYIDCGKPISVHLSIEEQTDLFYQYAYVEECNKVMAEMYGFQSKEEMIGQTIESLHRGEHYEINRNSFQDIVNNNYKVEEVETIEFTSAGEKRYFVNRVVGVVKEDHLIGMWGVQRDITESREAEIAFKKNISQYNSIVRDIKMGLWDWQLSTQTLRVNETYLELIGQEGHELVFEREEILGQIHPDDYPALSAASRYHLTHKTDNFQMAVRLGVGSNEWRWFQMYGRLVIDGMDDAPRRILGVLLDIHQLKIAEIRLQEGEALLKAVLDAIPDTKLHIKLDGTIIAVYGSPQKQAKQNYFSREVIGKKLKEVMPVFTAKGLLYNAVQAIKTNSLQTFEYLDVVKENIYYFEARISQVNEGEAIIMLRDITSVKKTENDLNEQIHKHDQNVRQLKKYIDSNLQLENFAYIASHDLREPIRTMRMFGQFLRKRIGDQLDEENLSYLDFIISGAKRMNGLIEGLLTYSRVDTEPLEKEMVATADLLANSIDNLSEAIEKQKAEVLVKAIPTHIYGSKIRLEQVFQNLISNGMKFSKPDTPPRIVISGEETPSHWMFKVKDNGIGIKEEFFERIFFLFKKLHNNNDFEGAGIGLALLKRIIEQHNGEIWLESEENVGTTFLFTLSKKQIGNE